MMHVMTAPASSAAAGTPAAGRAGRAGRSDGDGDFASMLAAHARPATGEPGSACDEASAPPSDAAEDAAAAGDLGPSPDAEPRTLLAVVAPAPASVDVAPPAEADGGPDGGNSDHVPPEGEDAPAARHAASGSTTTSTLLPASRTATTSATEVTTLHESVPAPATPAPEGTSTEPAQVQASAGAAPTVDGGTSSSARAEPQPSRTGHGAQATSGAESTAATTTAPGRAPAEPAPAVAGTSPGPIEAVAGPARRSMPERPAARVAAPGQADMAAAASATSDVDGAAPAASRPTEGPQPLPATVLDRVMRAVDALENAPPPKRVSFEVDGLRLTVSLRGDEVNVAVRGGGDQLGAGWQRDLDSALRGRGLGLADGQGSDADRGDGRRHPDDRPPHRSSGRGPAFRQPAAPDGDTSTNLHL